MAQYEKYVITAQRLTGIADAIREKKKTTDLLTPEQMVAEIRGIESGSPSAAEVTFGYVKKTETVTEQAPEGKCWYNGVLLPKVPADVLASYPYAFIRKNTTSGYYEMYCSVGVCFFVSSDNNIQFSDSTARQRYRIEIASAETSTMWEDNGTSTATVSIDSARTVLWSNHDIPNGSATATEIYFSGSEPLTELTETVTKLVPVERGSEYAVTSANLNDIAKRTQEMAGTVKLMTPEDIIYFLNRVKFILQGLASSTFSINFAPSTASGILPEVIKGAANTTFALPVFASSAVGELREG